MRASPICAMSWQPATTQAQKAQATKYGTSMLQSLSFHCGKVQKTFESVTVPTSLKPAVDASKWLSKLKSLGQKAG